jgi:Icc-related predicted phosphoesterase
MRIVAISDVHSAHRNFPLEQLPEGDTLIYAGDMTCHSTIEELEDFADWFRQLPHPNKIIIAGNHDRPLDNGTSGHLMFGRGVYLENEGITIDGLSFWGSPINEIEGSWAFNRDHDIQVAAIPAQVDVLVTHGPPSGILDAPRHPNHRGSRELADKIYADPPRLHIFGHIHDGYGTTKVGRTRFCNVAMQDGQGRMFREGRNLIHPPLVLDIQ